MRILRSDQNILIIENKGIILGVIIGCVITILGIITLIFPHLFSDSIPQWLSIILITIGILSFLIIKDSRYVFDKYHNLISFQEKYLYRRKITNFPLNQAKEILLSNYF